MKKLLSVILCVALFTGVCAAVFAEEPADPLKTIKNAIIAMRFPMFTMRSVHHAISVRAANEETKKRDAVFSDIYKAYISISTAMPGIKSEEELCNTPGLVNSLIGLVNQKAKIKELQFLFDGYVPGFLPTVYASDYENLKNTLIECLDTISEALSKIPGVQEAINKNISSAA